eukprot:scaffold2421_cov145-Skeletonema_marinoi.AAC.9
MSSSIPTITLSNGVQMPAIAIGTAPLSGSTAEAPQSNPNYVGFFPERVTRSVHLALHAGLRHIDTALMYRCHEHVAHVLRQWFMEGKLSREDVFITSKVFHPPAPGFGLDDTTIDISSLSVEEITNTVHAHFEKCLVELGVGYVDSMLLHWPSAGGGAGNATTENDNDSSSGTVMVEIDRGNRAKRLAAWKVLEHYYNMGWARSIGVSNFHEVHIQHLLDDGATIVPQINQLETSVYIQHTKIIQYCQEKGIAVFAFSPFGRGVMDMEKDEILLEVAKKQNVSPGQVALAYLVQHLKCAVSFYSSSKERMEGNILACSVHLDPEDVTKLEMLQRSASWGLPSPYTLT